MCSCVCLQLLASSSDKQTPAMVAEQWGLRETPAFLEDGVVPTFCAMDLHLHPFGAKRHLGLGIFWIIVWIPHTLHHPLRCGEQMG